MINFAKKLEPIAQLLQSEQDRQKHDEQISVLKQTLSKLEQMNGGKDHES